MSDPYLYIMIMLIVNIIALPGYLIFTEKSVMDKVVRTVIAMLVMSWQAYILLMR